MIDEIDMFYIVTVTGVLTAFFFYNWSFLMTDKLRTVILENGQVLKALVPEDWDNASNVIEVRR